MISNELLIMDNECIKLYESCKVLTHDELSSHLAFGKQMFNGYLPYGTIGVDYVKEQGSESMSFVTVMEPRLGNMSFRFSIQDSNKSSVGTNRRWKFPTLVFLTKYYFYSSGRQYHRNGNISSCQVYHLPNKYNEPIFDLLTSKELPLYKVPFSNIHSDSDTICSGSTGRRIDHPAAAIVDFYNSRFNRDLMDNIRFALKKQPIDPRTINSNNPEGVVTRTSMGEKMKDIILHPENYFDEKAEEELVQVATLNPQGRICNDEDGLRMIQYLTDKKGG
jgi:hypothetical protein